MLIKRTIYLLIALCLTGLVIWLGVRTVDDPSYVIWFGLASAFLPTAAMGAFKSAVTTDRNSEVIEKLSRVPEVEQLVTKAENEEERIRLLRQQRVRLDEIVRLEVRKQTLYTRREALEQDGLRIIESLRTVEVELEELQIDIEDSTVKDEIDKLEERLKAKQSGDLTFRLGSSYFRLSRTILAGLPFSVVTLLSQIMAEGLTTFSIVLVRGLSRFSERLTGHIARAVEEIKRRLRR